MNTKINLGGVAVSVPGFHPVIAVNLWRVARRAKNNKAFEHAFLEACHKRGMKVTVNGEQWSPS